MAFLSQVKIFITKKPMLFNSFIYGSFYVTAEFIQQMYHRKKHTENQVIEKINIKNQLNSLSTEITELEIINLKTDWSIIGRYFIYGYCIAGPILHGWYLWLDKAFVGTSQKIVISKLMCDQFMLTPALLFIFYTSMSLMEGKSDILHEFQMKFLKTFETSCLFWLPVQFINFLLVHPTYRVLYVSIASFCWVNILCNFKRTPTIA
ncbi:mpv17-like protein [Chelonus insularis]|uniref:mpv17-like protein n=1 Tax=Chelonus insularis TaxID=460826 RepID=UPI00158877F0|nr:mpv17-like protein [Chelonus insularis]